MSMATKTRLPSPTTSGSRPTAARTRAACAERENPIRYPMQVYMQVEIGLCSRVLILSRQSVHVPISVRSRSGKGVSMHFKSQIEVLFDSLSDNDCR